MKRSIGGIVRVSLTTKTCLLLSRTFRIDIPANRYDMLCVEGIARAVKTFLGLNVGGTTTTYSLSTPADMQEIHVSKEVFPDL